MDEPRDHHSEEELGMRPVMTDEDDTEEDDLGEEEIDNLEELDEEEESE